MLTSRCLLVFLLFRVVLAELCESNYWSEHDCHNARVKRDLPCHWNKAKDECHTIICSTYRNPRECNKWNDPYGCSWYELEDSAYGDLNLCHSQCFQYLDIVFTIDVSSSILEQPANRKDALNYVVTVMTLWWSIQEEIVSNSLNVYDPKQVTTKTAEYTRFGIVYFASRSITYLDLNYGLTLDDYISRVKTLFQGDYFTYLPFRKDDTNIASALHETHKVFENFVPSVLHPHGTPHVPAQHLAIFVTDGQPTVPEFAASPCASDYNFTGMFRKGIKQESIELFVALVASEGSNLADENVFKCFEKYGATVTPITGYHALSNAVPLINSPAKVCHVVTTEPTDEPTEPPTCSPTDGPTPKPTKVPSDEPTDKPTDAPTDKSTHKPTKRPTQKPTKKPTDKPTHKPTHKPHRNIYVRPAATPALTPRPTERQRGDWDKNPPAKEPTAKPTTGKYPVKQPTPSPAKPWWRANKSPN